MSQNRGVGVAAASRLHSLCNAARDVVKASSVKFVP